MAALAHASILMQQIGLIAPLVLWLVNEGKAPYAAYQAKQAFFFHLLVAVLTWVLVGLGLLFGVLTLGIGLFLAIPIISALPVAAMVYGIVAAVHSYNGRDFRYWLVGEWFKP
ncbi:MAG: uncharacterized protein JWN98_1403 [Abditibacteriota bacterium]|nr:uncharacterized protein [Abditibacteriota bacterium]